MSIGKFDPNLLNVRPTFQFAFDSQLNAILTVQYLVPAGQLLILTNAMLEAISGGAQTTNNVALSIVNPAGSLGVSIGGELFTAAASKRFDRSVLMHVPEGWKVQAQALFSAGAAANTLILNVIGFMLPSKIAAF